MKNKLPNKPLPVNRPGGLRRDLSKNVSYSALQTYLIWRVEPDTVARIAAARGLNPATIRSHAKELRAAGLLLPYFPNICKISREKHTPYYICKPSRFYE